MNLDSKIRYSVSEYSGVDVPKKFEMSLSARTFESCHDADDNGTDDEYSDDDSDDDETSLPNTGAIDQADAQDDQADAQNRILGATIPVWSSLGALKAMRSKKSQDDSEDDEIGGGDDDNQLDLQNDDDDDEVEGHRVDVVAFCVRRAEDLCNCGDGTINFRDGKESNMAEYNLAAETFVPLPVKGWARRKKNGEGKGRNFIDMFRRDILEHLQKGVLVDGERNHTFQGKRICC